MLPNFLIIGAMKAGTTSLYHYLRDHPQVFMPSLKEPLFFSRNWDKGLGWYESLFEEAKEAIAVGEASPGYTKYPHVPGVPARIAKLLPDVRLIYLVRDPVDRMVSQYEHRAKGGNARGLSLEEALLNDEAYCNVSSYAMQIDQYLEYFRPDQLLVLKSEDLKTDRIRTLRRVHEFLGVDGSWQPPHMWREFHTSSAHRRPVDHLVRKLPAYRSLASVTPLPLKRLKYRLTTRKAAPAPQLSDRVRRELEDRLRDDVKRLRDYMGEDLDEWGMA
jgi:hypothetical protein